MFSIKQSFADCSQCNLLDAESCILQSNVEKLSDVEIVFVAENPAKEEIKNSIPLCGRAGRIFRKFFNKLFKDKCNWLLTNCVLCITLNNDGTTGNPDQETIERCKINCFNIIKQCNPKLIVLMGTSTKNAFGIKGQITKISGEFFEWEGFNVMTTIHPSSINQPGGKKKEPMFEESLEKAFSFLKTNNKESLKNSHEVNIDSKNSKKGKFVYKLSDTKFYSKDYTLLDVQYLRRELKVLFIFKDKNGNKIYHKEDDKFVLYYSDSIECDKVIPYENLNQFHTKYSQIYSSAFQKLHNKKITYEADVSLEVKHTNDYYLRSKGEPDLDLNLLVTDIEVHTKGKRDFPTAEEANYPIAMITNCDVKNNKYKVFVFDVNGENLDKKIKNNYEHDVDILIYKSEKEMLIDWIKEIKRDDIDVITGWYVIPFDMSYIYHRLPKVGINQSSLSKFNEVYFNSYKEHIHIPGKVVLDGLKLYKEFTFTKLESYSLDAVCKKEIGRGKIDSGALFSDMFDKDINHSIHYNIVDVDLLVELNEVKKHFFLQNELRRICSCNFEHSMTPMGRLDSLLVSFLKGKGLASKTADPEGKSNKFEGAYVHEPLKGIHDWTVDFDFKSLYPSIILTYNIGVNTFELKLKDKYLGYELMYDRDNLPETISVIEDPFNKKVEKTYKKEDLLNKISSENLIYTSSGCLYKQHDDELSVYAEILSTLLSSRDNYKTQMFNAMNEENKSLEKLYDTRQQVYKILANALYGIIGNNSFRFYNLDLARTITLSGQEAIKHSIIKGEEFINSVKNKKELSSELANIGKNNFFSINMDIKTENIITGDTDSIFATFDKLIDRSKHIDEIIDQINNYCEKLQNFLNDDIMTNLVEKRNVDKERNKLKLKNELVIRRGLFLSKKHYGIYTIKKEGNDVDKIVDMGLDTKRSDYPSKTKFYIQELLEIILKSEKVSINRINKYVKDKEIEFIKLAKNGDKTIARPASFAKKIDDYKVIPQGVNGMLNWNYLIYNIFSTGSKGYLFKINGIDLSKAPEEVSKKYRTYFQNKGRKLDVIVVPEEEERLPEYFIPDVNKIVKFAWKDRYDLLLKPIINVKESFLTF